MRQVPALAWAIALLFVFAADAAEPVGSEPPLPAEKALTYTGTIEGTVKKIEPDAVVIERERDGQDIRLPVYESTKVRTFQEDDHVEAFVTPEGMTTSIQPRHGGLRR